VLARVLAEARGVSGVDPPELRRAAGRAEVGGRPSLGGNDTSWWGTEKMPIGVRNFRVVQSAAPTGTIT